MFDKIVEYPQHASKQIEPGKGSLFPADIPDQMVTHAMDAIISRMAPTYLDLIREAKENPEIISSYKSSQFNYYKNKYSVLSHEENRNVLEAIKMLPECDVITNRGSSEYISVFSDKNKKLDVNRTLDESRLYITFRFKAKDIKNEDPLDQMLSQLSQKILAQGYGDEGHFDVRLEKGILPVEGSPWKWHFDGEIFKTSITLCYSSKENWSTQVRPEMGIERPAAHGVFYDALHVYHRAPIPSDLENYELNVDDYRLFIRYTEPNTKIENLDLNLEKVGPNKGIGEKKKDKASKNPFSGLNKPDEGISFLLSEYSSRIPKSEFLRIVEDNSRTKELSVGLLNSQPPLNSELVNGLFAKYSESLLIPPSPALDLTCLPKLSDLMPLEPAHRSNRSCCYLAAAAIMVLAVACFTSLALAQMTNRY